MPMVEPLFAAGRGPRAGHRRPRAHDHGAAIRAGAPERRPGRRRLRQQVLL